METIYLACCRGSVSESLAMIPAKELPTYEEFKAMEGYFDPVEPDLAWSDVFPQVSSWLTKREHIRKERERNAPSDPNSGGMDFHR